MSLPVEILMYFAIGFVEWVISARRFSAQMDFEMCMAPMLVLIEGLLAWFVIDRFIASRDWTIVVCTAAGGALGIWVEMKRRKAAKEKENMNKEEK